MHRPALLLTFAAVLVAALAVGPAAGVSTPTDSNETVLAAEMHGTTATNVSIPADSLDTTRTTVADELGVDERAVRVVPENATVEARARNVSTADMRAALAAAGLDATNATIGQHVTAATQAETVAVLQERFERAGVDATVTGVVTDAGDRDILVRSATASRADLVDVASFGGTVEFVAHFPVERDGETVYRDVTLLTNDDFRTVGEAQAGSASSPAPYVPVTLTEQAARNYSDAMQNFGFTSERGIQNCDTDTARQDPDDATGYCLYTVTDGNVVFAAQMSAGLARMFENGEFVTDPEFVVTARNMSRAQNLSLALRAGALPAPLSFDDAQASVVENATGSDESASESNETTATTSSGGPGFTGTAALVGLFSVAVLGLRSRERSD